MFYAHTPNAAGNWHELKDHLAAVAQCAAEFAAEFDADRLARWSGLIHDLGKASEEFQSYLRECADHPDRRPRSVDHKGAGTLATLGLIDELAFVIQGHHGGLSDKGTILTKVKELRGDGGALAREGLRRAQEAGLLPDSPPGKEELHYPDFVTDALSLEWLLRFVFSAIVDADFLDTEAHWNPIEASERSGVPDLSDLRARLDSAQHGWSGQRTDPVNRIRDDVYRTCLLAASETPGFFRLTVPTGGGKTRSAMAFALHHAERHGLRRVIYVSPYLTITDQTADVYRDIFGNDRAVLEHHSDAARNDDPTGEPTPEASWRRLAAENWDAPIIVTTAVQFFESLFGRLPSVCRKLHRIPRSVVILDEAQTIPTEFLAPILDGLAKLVADYRVSVVICTATQPAFARVPGFPALPSMREIVPDSLPIYRALKRVTYEWPALSQPWDWAQAATILDESPQALAIVNTKADALNLLDALADDQAFHLSTALCGAHRRDVLASIRSRLEREESCRVVSTQVVEAGVDLDFPVVLRALGPLDRIVQAAGRCNREGRLATGRVVVFDPAEGRQPPGPYRTGTDVTRVLLAAGPLDPDDPATFERYFARLYGSVPLDAHQIQPLRRALAFEQTAMRFRLIPDDTVSVFVRYRGLEKVDGVANPRQIDHDARNRELLNAFRALDRRPGRSSGRDLLRRAQPYLVAVPRRVIDRLREQGLVAPLVGDVWLWEARYDSVRGIGRLDASGYAAADLVV